MLLYCWQRGSRARCITAAHSHGPHNNEDDMFNRKGFTLIELLIVVVIIGILAAIAIPKFATTKDKAKLASIKTDLRNLMTAQEAYFSDYSTYAANVGALTAAPYNFSSRPATRSRPWPASRAAGRRPSRTPPSRAAARTAARSRWAPVRSRRSTATISAPDLTARLGRTAGRAIAGPVAFFAARQQGEKNALAIFQERVMQALRSRTADCVKPIMPQAVTSRLAWHRRCCYTCQREHLPA